MILRPVTRIPNLASHILRLHCRGREQVFYCIAFPYVPTHYIPLVFGLVHVLWVIIMYTLWIPCPNVIIAVLENLN